jgi:HK97 family phage major capsid protein
MLELRARQLALYTELPNTLMADAPALVVWINANYPRALKWAEDLAFIKGNGVGKPQGFLNAQCAVEVAKETGQAADTILWKNLVKVYSRMLPDALMRFVWVANLDTLPELATLKEQVGTGGSLIWIGEGQGENAPPVRILGRPVIFSEKMPTIGDAGDVTAWDPASYVIGDREMMMVDSSSHYKFKSGHTAVKVVERVDGRTTVMSALTPETGSNTLSPVVKIAAR